MGPPRAEPAVLENECGKSPSAVERYQNLVEEFKIDGLDPNGKLPLQEMCSKILLGRPTPGPPTQGSVMLACQAHSIMDNRFPSKNTEQVPHLLDPGDEELRQALFALARDGTNSRLVMVYPKAERKELDEGASGHHFLLVAKFVQFHEGMENKTWVLNIPSFEVCDIVQEDYLILEDEEMARLEVRW